MVNDKSSITMTRWELWGKCERALITEYKNVFWRNSFKGYCNMLEFLFILYDAFVKVNGESIRAYTHVGELGNEAIHVVVPSVSMLSGTGCRVFCPLKAVLQSQVFFMIRFVHCLRL